MSAKLFRVIFLGLIGLFATAGCSMNPATGQRQLVMMGEAQEIGMGREADQQIVASYGLYPEEQWQEYIQALGGDLAAQSERPNLPWTFRVLDDPIVNAFALPGGYIYITRGILAHFNSEAELASVIGHEIGHVTGRHGVERMSKAQLANLGLGVAVIASEEFRPYAGLAQQSMGLLFLKFSRDDEREADRLGLRYMTRGDFQADEMPKVFQTLDRVSVAAGAGRLPSWLATHPNPQDRALRIQQELAQLDEESRNGSINRELYVQRLGGLTFGADPRQGYVVGEKFYHPTMKFQMKFPEGWVIQNQTQAVVALAPSKDAALVLTLDSNPNARQGVQKFFAQGGLERGRQYGDNFYAFRTLPNDQGQNANIIGLVRYLEYDNRVYRLMGYGKTDGWGNHRSRASATLKSFRTLTDRKHLEVEPSILRIVEVSKPMTLGAFNTQFPSTVSLERLAILNGVETNHRFQAGDRVKRIVGGELPTH